jgi:hypothetical protein
MGNADNSPHEHRQYYIMRANYFQRQAKTSLLKLVETDVDVFNGVPRTSTSDHFLRQGADSGDSEPHKPRSRLFSNEPSRLRLKRRPVGLRQSAAPLVYKPE